MGKPFRRLRWPGLFLFCLLFQSFSPALAASPSSTGVGNILQGVQSDKSYAQSFQTNQVSNVFATTQKVSCYRPEVPFFTSLSYNRYNGMTGCNGAANTGEDTGANSIYSSQQGSNPGYPASGPMLVKDHSESDLRVDPTDPNHLIGASKWFVSAEGYNHLLGFYESFDGGNTWPIQGHIPGYEGWTDNTDPIGAFDSYGNYYSLILPYMFFYNKDGSHNFTVGNALEPNPSVPAEVIAVSVRPHRAAKATDWITTHNGQPDYVATYDSVGNEPDKQWITIDTHPTLPNGQPNPNYNTIYAMWVVFNDFGSKPYVSTAKALPDGTHTDWTTPELLPTVNNTAADTYLLPSVDPSGVVWTTVTNFPSAKSFCCVNLSVIYSKDGGASWQGPLTVASKIQQPPLVYANTTFRSGIENSFAVGSQLSSQGYYPLYVAWEDYSAGVSNIILSASYDGGVHWNSPIQVNDNANPNLDSLQANLTVGNNGRVSVAFYDRRLACPAAGSKEAVGAGINQDTYNPNYSGTLPPYGATNYCLNASVQFYDSNLNPLGHNIRLTQNTFDPQLNAPHTSCPTCTSTFIGDYFGTITTSSTNYFSFVTTFNDGTNPENRQQQIIAKVKLP